MKKFLCIGLYLFIWLSVLSGCVTKYKAVMDSNAQKWLSDEFLKENKVKGANYLNEDYIDGESDLSDKYIRDNNSPESRTFIITDKDEFNKVFTKYTSKINFDNKMVVLYVFPDDSPREYIIKKVVLEGVILSIDIKLKSGKYKDSTAPYPRCLMVIIDRLDITTVSFNEVK